MHLHILFSTYLLVDNTRNSFYPNCDINLKVSLLPQVIRVQIRICPYRARLSLLSLPRKCDPNHGHKVIYTYNILKYLYYIALSSQYRWSSITQARGPCTYKAIINTQIHQMLVTYRETERKEKLYQIVTKMW